MATYYNNEGKKRHLKPIDLGWSIMSKEQYEKECSENLDDFSNMVIHNYVPIESKWLEDVAEDVDIIGYDNGSECVMLYFDDNVSNDKNILEATLMTYPSIIPSGSDDIPDERIETELYLTKAEKTYFTELLNNNTEIMDILYHNEDEKDNVKICADNENNKHPEHVCECNCNNNEIMTAISMALDNYDSMLASVFDDYSEIDPSMSYEIGKLSGRLREKIENILSPITKKGGRS